MLFWNAKCHKQNLLLEQADNLDEFYDIIFESILRSFDIYLKAIKSSIL